MIQNMQEHLLYLTKFFVLENKCSEKIRGVMAIWDNENTAHISFYFDGEPQEKELEDASDTCGEIIAHIPDGLLKEDYIRLDCPKQQPESPFWAYKRSE